MIGQKEQIPTLNLVTYEMGEGGNKIAKIDVLLPSGETITLRFASRFQGKQQLLERALLAKNYENLYRAVASIPDTELSELTKEEIEDLTEHNPQGYALDDYLQMNTESALIIEGNPVGVEYTLTFGTGNGKYLTHGGAHYSDYREQFSKFQREGNLLEAEKSLREMRKRMHMEEDYHRLTHYAHASSLAGKSELQKKAVAEIRAFRKLHPWVYEGTTNGPKKKFIIQP